MLKQRGDHEPEAVEQRERVKVVLDGRRVVRPAVVCAVRAHQLRVRMRVLATVEQGVVDGLGAGQSAALLVGHVIAARR